MRGTPPRLAWGSDVQNTHFPLKNTVTILEGRISFNATLIGTILNSKDVYSKRSFQRWVESQNLSDELKNIIVSSLIYTEKEGNDKSKHESAFPYAHAPNMRAR